MTKALKAALLSGLVLPGLGQMILKFYKRGIALMLMTLGALIVIAVQATQQAITILERIEAEGGAVDLGTISNAATEASTASNTTIFNIALLFLISCWIISIIDAYRLGKKKDLELKTA
jgi:TM2 domain-containing membrane protein YozV